jgi:hypothetical protein
LESFASGHGKQPHHVSRVCCLALLPSKQKFDRPYIIHYMDDILLSHPNLYILQKLLAHVLEQLPKWSLIVAPKKVQQQFLFIFGPDY